MSHPRLGLSAIFIFLVSAACSGVASSPTDTTVDRGGARPVAVALPAAQDEGLGLEGQASGPSAVPALEAPDTDGTTAVGAAPTADETQAEDDTPVDEAAQATDELFGRDGRLSVLILGTDVRKGIDGERTDAIIVATIDPETGRVAMVSLPRDTVDVPISARRVYRSRINTLYQSFVDASGDPRKALRKTRKALAHAFDTEIDYYALVDFGGLVRLIDSLGGVEVTLEERLVDPTMHLSKKGLRLKAGKNRLDGKKALAFARTRHTDDDYNRSRRQHQLLAATAQRVLDLGPAALPALVRLADRKVITDLPLAAAPALLELAGRARLERPKSMVLAPRRFARPGRQVYTIQPRVGEMRKMFDRVFKPVR